VSSNLGYSDALRRQTDLSNISSDYNNTGFTFEDKQRYLSNYFVKDAFIKLDNVTVGYTLKAY
jgi:iron complex outermembrane receptor protein